MMQNLTNDIKDVLDTVRKEINNFKWLKPGQKVLNFCRKPHDFATFAAWQIDREYDTVFLLRKREWNPNAYLKRFGKGPYDLDAIEIKEKVVLLPNEDVLILLQMLKDLEEQELPQSVEKERAILLHASDWRLLIDYNNLMVLLSWQAADERIKPFEKLLDWLIALDW